MKHNVKVAVLVRPYHVLVEIDGQEQRMIRYIEGLPLLDADEPMEFRANYRIERDGFGLGRIIFSEVEHGSVDSSGGEHTECADNAKGSEESTESDKKARGLDRYKSVSTKGNTFTV